MTTILLLHGGGGPLTVAPLATHLSESHTVIAPTHPGWAGTERPASIDTIRALANYYLAMLARENLTDVILIGSSIGGWLAAEMAVADHAHRVAGLVIINGVGVDVPGETITNVTGLAPQELAKLSFHDPANFTPPPATPEVLAIMKGNQDSLLALTGDPYGYDPTLLSRLAGIHVPTLVLWGESDRVVSATYGRAYAAAIPDARFELIAEAGHLPYMESPAAVFAALDPFVA
ncbi:MAG TPA: alpha/beta fold hydrolase [Galbitalea sp.]|jgi:pimeloyl-ACP methyl ester carboxylesterase